MNFIENIKNRAKQDLKTIVLPEATDLRVLKATEIVLSECFAHIVLVGKKDEILNLAKSNNLDISKAEIEDPETSEKTQKYAESLYELRKNKGMELEEAQKLILDPVYYGTMMVKLDEADGLVSGAIHSTADTLRPALQILKTAPGTKLVSAFFLMEVPDCKYGEDGMFVFADCGLNQHPDSEQLAEIAYSSAKSLESLTSAQARVAMLSYSTYGSAKAEEIDKVVNATKIAKENHPELIIDGELQLDSAIIPEVSELKAPESPLKGRANVLVFPDLNAGNIGYKLVQRLAKANAYGPICQGIAKPVNDLSRGCSAEDVAGVVAITAVQAQKE